MELVLLQFNRISKIIGNDDLALLELVTDDGLKQLSVVCEGAMTRQFAIRLSDVPIRHKLLPEVLWTAFGKGKSDDIRIVFASFLDGEYMAFLFDNVEGRQWPVRASDAVLLSLVAGLPIYAHQKLIDTCSTPVDKSGKGVTLPVQLLPADILRKELDKAVLAEDYEKASLLRDELKKREQ
ncbi:MAG: bifunctional nuclease family protein [Prevotella sp.]|nr:bifunctional nuclease family protein [Prevotella sp.]